ncbi:MAG TPA: histidine phosphatase family protein [Thermoanaerobaculia bacterium]|nr:histidine phosphatase family protein [Thermoanaerobaculia bacterium]
MKRTVALLAVLVFAFVALAEEPSPVTTVILVRHAEKDLTVAQDDNTPLSKEGAERAQRLKRMLIDSGVSVIYTTKTTRTRTTAGPLAEALHLEAKELEKTDTPAMIADKIRAHKGATLLVVGHSNTTPNIMKALGIANAPSIDDKTEFDNLFIVTLADSAAPSMTRIRY